MFHLVKALLKGEREELGGGILSHKSSHEMHPHGCWFYFHFPQQSNFLNSDISDSDFCTVPLGNIHFCIIFTRVQNAHRGKGRRWPVT